VRLLVLVLVLTVLPLGCHHPLRTESVLHHAFETPVSGQVSMETHMFDPLPAGGGPIYETPIDGLGVCAQEPRIALIDVDGILLNQDMAGPYSWGDNPVAIFREKLDAAAANPAIRSVVVRINSPGGGVTATDMMWRDLRAFRSKTNKPVIACLLDLGTGGSYYLATAADLIVAHPTTITGGIGVIWNSYNLKELMALQSIIPQPIKAGPNIDMGSMSGSLTPETRVSLQKMADEFHLRFKGVVKEARPGLKEPATTFDGRVFTATEALGRGLVDQIGYLDDAIAMARTAAHLDQSRVVLYRRRHDDANSPYAITANTPLQSQLIPVSIPGIERSRLPTFLYLWQPEPTLEKLGGR
jgi:protease IV